MKRQPLASIQGTEVAEATFMRYWTPGVSSLVSFAGSTGENVYSRFDEGMQPDRCEVSRQVDFVDVRLFDGPGSLRSFVPIEPGQRGGE